MKLNTVKIKKNIKNILLYTFVVFILGEFVTRILDKYFVNGKVGSLYSYVVTNGDSWNFQPGVTVIQPERYGDRSYSLNNYGYRGRNVTLENNKRRILLLGDSITFGLGVQDSFTYSVLVENALNDKVNGDFELINLALPSYSPYDELATLKKIGLGLQPELIILQLYMNDFQEMKNQNNNVPTTTQPTIRPSISQRFFILKELIFSKSAFLRRVRQICQMFSHRMFHDFRRTHFINTLNDKEPKERMELFISNPQDQDIDGFDDIEGMYRLTKEFNINFLVVLTPNEVQLFNEDYDLINKRVRAFCERKNIPFLDPTYSMRSSGNKDKIFCDGLHLSEFGHKFFTDWILPVVESNLNINKQDSNNLW